MKTTFVFLNGQKVLVLFFQHDAEILELVSHLTNPNLNELKQGILNLAREHPHPRRSFGYSDYEYSLIAIAPARTISARMTTLAHELGHWMIWQSGVEDTYPSREGQANCAVVYTHDFASRLFCLAYETGDSYERSRKVVIDHLDIENDDTRR